MKLKVSKEELIKNVQNVYSAISSRVALPILANILIEAKKDTVKLTATNLDITIVSTFKNEVIEDGDITIPANLFFNIIKQLGKDIALSTKDNVLIIKSGKSQFKINCLPKEDFPKLPKLKSPQSINLEQKLLKTMLNKVSFSMSKDETRFVLNGVLFQFKDNKLTVVSTDGKRLSLTNTEIKSELENVKLIIPKTTISILSKILLEEGTIDISFSDKLILFELENLIIISNVIEGEFPNYEEVIPKENKDKITIDNTLLLPALKRASILTNEMSLSVKLSFSKNLLTITKNNGDIGEIEEKIDLDYDKESIDIAFNPYYLIDIIKVVDDKINIEITAPDKPAIVRKEDSVYLVLPMQLN